jgi:16S rRNA (cytidine1402-2'-O)-methyltransferase
MARRLSSASRPRAVVVSSAFVRMPENMTEESAALYVVPTPLGNLADLTRRAEEILRTVPWVAAEDTRHSGPLLKQLGARARTLPAHQHNEHEAAARIVEKLQAGESVALISDAGTPGISDPGARIVAAVRAAGCRVVPLPGPCAATTALSASGLLDEHFLFYGFLPAKGGQRRQALEALPTSRRAGLLRSAASRAGNGCRYGNGVRPAHPGHRRELTKLFETIHSLPLPEALDWLKADPNRQRGEFVLMLSGATAGSDSGEGERVLKLLLADGLPTKQAAKLAASITGASKNALYDLALSLKAQGWIWPGYDGVITLPPVPA